MTPGYVLTRFYLLQSFTWLHHKICKFHQDSIAKICSKCW